MRIVCPLKIGEVGYLSKFTHFLVEEVFKPNSKKQKQAAATAAAMFAIAMPLSPKEYDIAAAPIVVLNENTIPLITWIANELKVPCRTSRSYSITSGFSD